MWENPSVVDGDRGLRAFRSVEDACIETAVLRAARAPSLATAWTSYVQDCPSVTLGSMYVAPELPREIEARRRGADQLTVAIDVVARRLTRPLNGLPQHRHVAPARVSLGGGCRRRIRDRAPNSRRVEQVRTKGGAARERELVAHIGDRAGGESWCGYSTAR